MHENDRNARLRARVFLKYLIQDWQRDLIESGYSVKMARTYKK